MYCEKCGTLVAENEKFCPKCGASINNQSEINTETNADIPTKEHQAAAVTQIEEIPSGNVAAKVKKPIKINKKLLISVISIVCVLIVLISVVSAILGMIRPDSYFADSISLDGYNGYTSLDPSDLYNFDGLMYDLSGKDSTVLTEKINEKYRNDAYDEYGVLGALYEDEDEDGVLKYLKKDAFSIECEPTENLKNGDKVTVTVTIDTDVINSLGLKKKLKLDDKLTRTYTIENLKETVKLDPMKEVQSVYYDETEQKVKIKLADNLSSESFGNYSANLVDINSNEQGIQLVNNSDEEDSLATLKYFGTAEDYNSTGKVTVNVAQNGYYSTIEETAFAENGIILTNVSKEFDVTKISYINDKTNVTVDDYTAIKECGNSSNYFSDGNKTFINLYMCLGNYQANNQFVCVYSYADSYDNKIYYSYLPIKGAKADSNGTLYTDNLSVDWSRTGFTSEKELLKNLQEYYSTVKLLTVK
ncbi:MAG: zinc-ribbon domain-containing protein [Clostridia bacterium]|nr:zinc-ribbon domain-containing protein [Clostridia bacterium]